MYELQILTWLCVLPDFNSNLPHWYAYAAKQMPLLESSAISGIFYPWPSPQFHHGHVWADHFFAGPLRTKYEIEAAPAPVEMTIFHQNFKILILSHIFPA
jgi:hypothetical protein